MSSVLELRPSARIYPKVRHAIPRIEWPAFAEDVDAIIELKKRRNAVVLAHNYQTPEIFHGVADIVGDSLALARKATEVEADVIVLAGVHFMAETAKLLNPSKTVLIPDTGAGCSLAELITPEDVRLLRKTYPGTPIVTYVNTSAAVKAELDICCTSGNAKAVSSSSASNVSSCCPTISGEEHRCRNPRQDHRLDRALRSARALQRRRGAAVARRLPRRGRAGTSGMPAGGCRGSRFRRIDRRPGFLCRHPTAASGRAPDGMLDERQCRR